MLIHGCKAPVSYSRRPCKGSMIPRKSLRHFTLLLGRAIMTISQVFPLAEAHPYDRIPLVCFNKGKRSS